MVLLFLRGNYILQGLGGKGLDDFLGRDLDGRTGLGVAADAGDAEAVAKAIARMLNDLPQLMAIAEGANGVFYVQSRVDGFDFTLADAGGGTGTITSVTQVEASAG